MTTRRPLPNARKSPFCVFLIGEVLLYLEGLAMAFSRHSIPVVGIGPPDAATLRCLARARPSVVLIDASVRCGSDFVHAAARSAPPCRVLAFGVRNVEEDVLSWAGA